MSCVQLSEGVSRWFTPRDLWSRCNTHSQSCQSPTWKWLANYFKLHVHAPARRRLAARVLL